MTHLVLTGLSGAGKSTIGRLLADRLNRPFVDLDRFLEAEAKQSIAAIFAQYGESEFRRRESLALQTALHGVPSVISAGGGTLVSRESRDRVRDVGLVVWLQVSPPTAAKRVRGSEERPLLSGDMTSKLEKLLQARRTSYADCDISLDTDALSPEEVTERVLQWLETRSTI